jgi:hydrogenase maturation protein HypF
VKIRNHITINGIVQGVGFRPFIHKVADDYKLKGWICNSTEGVELEIEGEEDDVKNIAKILQKKHPPLAMIKEIKVKKMPLIGFKDFRIVKSYTNNSSPVTLIPPDISICDECIKELNNPSDRRYCYPFINCTNCGPRFTIIKDIPYDRDKTTMREFLMCHKCSAEYSDITNRRYHAQPNACHTCGPEVILYQGEKRIITDNPFEEVQRRLKTGQIGAIKGLGGFHLTCDAMNDSAVSRLREIKLREQKPFAVMVKDIDSIKKFCHLSKGALKILNSRERPILLLKKKTKGYLSENIAPGNNYIGVMLAYTPLHYLLFQKSNFVLVMTSANFRDEPIIYQNQEAFDKLVEKVDFLLVHNRPIYNRCDDSVIKYSFNRAIFIRRARGYAPYPIILSKKARQIFAAGPEDKNTVCFTRDEYAFPSQHLGDLKNQENYEAYQEAIDRIINVFQFNPELIACDLHPDYLSTVFAEKMSQEKGLPLLKVQHHQAHIASCMAENNLNEKVIGVVFDGSGLGEDGTIWGGEFLISDIKSYKRVGHLKYKPMPGGELAIHQPWRMAYSYLYSYFGEEALNLKLPFIRRNESNNLKLLMQMIDKKINSPSTSSCGRLFDAIASLIGLRDEVDFEGQAAIELESICKLRYKENYAYNIIKKSESASEYIVNTEYMFKQVINDLEKNVDIKKIATQFHNTVAEIILSMCVTIREQYGINKVVLSGGVFQNSFLLNQTIKRMNKKNFVIFLHKKMPPNDACISLGQAVIANARGLI